MAPLLIPGLIMLILGAVFIIFRKTCAKVIAGSWNYPRRVEEKTKSKIVSTLFKMSMRPKSYEDDNTGNWAMILLGIFFVIIGLLLILYPGLFS